MARLALGQPSAPPRSASASQAGGVDAGVSPKFPAAAAPALPLEAGPGPGPSACLDALAEQKEIAEAVQDNAGRVAHATFSIHAVVNAITTDVQRARFGGALYPSPVNATKGANALRHLFRVAPEISPPAAGLHLAEQQARCLECLGRARRRELAGRAG